MKRRPTYQRFPLGSRLRERLVLRDGRELLLRPIHPDDEAPIRGSFDLLGSEEIRMRYLHAIKALGEDYLRRLTHPMRGRECVLVLAEPLPPGESLVGAVARYSREQGATDAEFAIIVSHFLAGQGLGYLLLSRLIACAKQRRLRSLYGDVLADNHAMLRLAAALGFLREGHADPGIVRVRRMLES
ncbi:MAG: GNAT family N-acetyltransferase [Proteobacteria bacterium]|nr:GNAT family N-acetyltransferase [Pseudomonadota bacterium]